MAKIDAKLVQKNGLDVRTGAFTQGDRVRKQMKAYSAGIFDEVPEASEASKKKYPVTLIGLRLIKSREEGNAFSQSNISGLKESIRECGLIDPIQVLETGEGDYRIIAGHRRYTAFSQLYEETQSDDYKAIPAIVYQLTENKDLNLTMNLSCEKVFITKETEEKIYADSNLQSRQLSYGEVAQFVEKMIKKLEDDDYRKRVSQDVHKVEFSKLDRGKQISLLLADYKFEGWSVMTVKRFIDIVDLSKYSERAKEAVSEISKPFEEGGEKPMSVKTASRALEDEIKFYKILEAPVSTRSAKKFSSVEKNLRKKWSSAEEKNEELFEQLFQVYKELNFSDSEEEPKKKSASFTALKKSMVSFLSKKSYTSEELKELHSWMEKMEKILESEAE